MSTTHQHRRIDMRLAFLPNIQTVAISPGPSLPELWRGCSRQAKFDSSRWGEKTMSTQKSSPYDTNLRFNVIVMMAVCPKRSAVFGCLVLLNHCFYSKWLSSGCLGRRAGKFLSEDSATDRRISASSSPGADDDACPLRFARGTPPPSGRNS